MKILFDTHSLQNKNIKKNQLTFKATKTITLKKLQKSVIDHNKFIEALKANSIVQKIHLDIPRLVQKTSIREAFAKFANPKSISFFRNYMSLDYNMENEEEYLAKLDYLDFVANNIEDAEFNKNLFKITNIIKPILLPLAKHLTSLFPNNLENIYSQLNNYKHLFSPQPALEERLNHLNQKNLDTNSFLQIVELIKFDNSINEFDSMISDLLLSEQKDIDVGLLRKKIFEIYANKRKVLKINDQVYDKYDTNFIKETSNFLKEKGDKIHPLMLHSFISHVRPHNFNVVEYLCSNNCCIDNLATRANLVNKFEGDVDCSNFLNFLKDIQVEKFDDNFLIGLTSAYINPLKYLFHEEKIEILQKIINLRNKIIENPEKYLTNDNDISVDIVFNNYTNELAKTFYVYDEKTIDELFDKRLKNVTSFLQSFTAMPRNLDLLQELTYCTKKNGEKFSSTEKLNFARIVSVFNDSEIKKLEDMALDGVVDLERIKKDFFYKMLKNLDFNQNEILSIDTKNFEAWNITYLPMITQIINRNAKGFSELFKASFSYDFWKYIHDEKHEIGKINIETKKIFEENGMSYEKWIYPPKTIEVKTLVIDKNNEILRQIASSLEENIEAIRKSPLKPFFDKRFGEYIENDCFVLPKNTKTSPEQLKNFIKNILIQLEPVWKRAKNNLEKDESKKEHANNTLTIKDHLVEMQKKLSNILFSNTEKTIDLTIKMWDRDPKKDLFQGNYSTCCIALDRTNGHIMPDYLLSTSLNMIELVDNEVDKTIGNALCYFVLNNECKPSFVIDNIEVNNNYILSKESGAKIFDKIVEYVKNLCKEISSEEIPIYVGNYFNDIKPQSESVIQNLKFLGEITTPRVYLDAYSGWSNYKLKKEVSIRKV